MRLPSGESVPLTAVAEWRSRRGFEVLRHAEGSWRWRCRGCGLGPTPSRRIIASLEADTLPELQERFRWIISFEGRSADQRETMGDMRKGLMLGLVLIYLILAWVFASYGWPLVVMAAIPFGLTGALFGHWLMGST